MCARNSSLVALLKRSGLLKSTVKATEQQMVDLRSVIDAAPAATLTALQESPTSKPMGALRPPTFEARHTSGSRIPVGVTKQDRIQGTEEGQEIEIGRFCVGTNLELSTTNKDRALEEVRSSVQCLFD